MPQYRQERNYENLNKGLFDSVGQYDIPTIQPVSCNTEHWIGFNYAKTCDECAMHGVHFFIDDYQFTRVWTTPDVYCNMLKRFAAVLTPDFSTYTDFPRAIQLYNHYRKHWLGAYWQHHGLKVIPTISWSDEDSLNWCFDGEPIGGTVAVSAVGTQMDPYSRELFKMGYDAMMEKLHPETVIFYGAVPEDCDAEKIIRIAAFQDRLKKCNKQKDVI